ncbi:MAG: helix-turn-helix transcriptional regulator [Synergistaceae bacterium]|nr:helix-turn-helix transcriptional regulator [Synergistaceae bacterium]
MSVGKRIRALRVKCGISSQEELAYLTGTARQTVSSWERDIFLPDGANLIKLAMVLNTSIAYIMGETENPAGGGSPDAAAIKPNADMYIIKAGHSKCPQLSFEKSSGGKTVRYDLPPKLAAKIFPVIEELWNEIEKEME